MKIRTKEILLILVFVIALPVCASSWKQIDEKQYVDIDSIELYEDKYASNNGIKYSFWIKSLNNKSKAFLDDEKYYNKKIWYKMVRMLVDCKNKTLAIKAFAIYGLKGQVLDGYEVPEYEIQWTSIIPDSVGENYYYGVCLP